MKVAIVDGFSTGRVLVETLRGRGVRCVHVQSSAAMPEFFTKGFRREDYEVDLGCAGDVPALVDALSRLGITHVVAGTESGVVLADTLAHALGLAGNDHRTVRSRRDKAVMAATASAAGLRVPLGHAFTDADAAAAWYAGSGLHAAVVKPPASAGTDNVHFCADVAGVREAGRAVLSARNLYGEPNRRVLVQERIDGTEFYVNTVSGGGAHRAAEIWRYHKVRRPTGCPVYDYEDPVDPGSVEAGVLREFVFAVLDALGVRAGAAHTEVMLTDSGPVLIECGARLGGATTPWVVEKYSGVSQTTLFADALIDPARLCGFDDTRSRWSAAVRNVAFVNHRAGTVRSLDWADRVRGLPTAVDVVTSVRPGAVLAPTDDLLSSPGYVYLASDDEREVERDYLCLREMETAGLYTG